MKESTTKNEKTKLYGLLLLLTIITIVIVSATQVYNTKPAVHIYDGNNLYEIQYFSYSSVEVGQSDLSYIIKDGTPAIRFRLTEKDSPTAIKVYQGTTEYVLLVYSPGEYEIPLIGIEGGETRTTFIREDGLYHTLTHSFSEEENLNVLYPPLEEGMKDMWPA